MIRLTVAFLIACTTQLSSAQQLSPDWLVGNWTVISDEDGTPPDFAEFTVDGKYVNYGFNCTVRNEMPFHFYNGDIYITSEIQGKGPIAIVFRPSADKKTLTFTSPRTRRNAVMAHIKERCK